MRLFLEDTFRSSRWAGCCSVSVSPKPGARSSSSCQKLLFCCQLRLLSEARLQSGASWLVGLFTSVGWANTFSLALEGTAIYKIQFSSRLVMAILGGAILPPLQGWLADNLNSIQRSLLVPLIAYDAFYGALGHRIGRADGSANRKHRPTGSRSISRSLASHHLLGCW